MPRRGYLTPSSFADLMTSDRSTSLPGKAALKVINRLVVDLLGVELDDDGDIVPRACAWGQENEWLAIQSYTECTLSEVKAPVEFRVAPDMPYVGGTMDGLVGLRGGIEVKCPFNPAEHLANLTNLKQLEDYKYQIQGYHWIYELDWIDFISFDPRYPEPYDLVIHRVEPDEEIITALKERCVLAYEMAVDKLIKIRGAISC